jgi:NADH dehydrogenase [ubiquinone] 1 alpha subcomplex assembly factor 8
MSTAASTAGRPVRPIRKFAVHSTTTCSAQATEYGKCILGTYVDVKKDSCKDEFARFGKCMREAVRNIC